MVVTELGIVNMERRLHQSNALSPMDEAESGIVNEVSLSQ